MPIPYGFTYLDAFAFVFFFLIWVSHYYVINRSRWKSRTITAAMSGMREQWMHNMVARGDTPVDAIIQNALQQGVLFFASTTVLLIGGLVAALGSADKGFKMLQELPLSEAGSIVQLELKILLIVFIFVMAFFKFAWSYRLFNYTLIMIGAAPHGEQDEARRVHYAKKVALLHSLASKHFTTGLNAYFFALAACTWLLNAWLFIAATLWVALVLYRRAFRAEFLRLLLAKEH